jgi:hypothetical protein
LRICDWQFGILPHFDFVINPCVRDQTMTAYLRLAETDSRRPAVAARIISAKALCLKGFQKYAERAADS